MVKVSNPTLCPPPRTTTSTDSLDMVHTQGQKSNSLDGEVVLSALSSRQSEPETLVKDQKPVDNPVKLSLDVENLIISRLPCDSGFPNGDPENPSIGHSYDNLESASPKEAIN